LTVGRWELRLQTVHVGSLAVSRHM